jgi:predicted transposase/invertase (TIGR01784 family)
MLAENLENLVKKERLEGRDEGREEGREEGQHEARTETARNLVNRTEMDDTMIAEISGLPVESVAKLRSETKH